MGHVEVEQDEVGAALLEPLERGAGIGDTDHVGIALDLEHLLEEADVCLVVVDDEDALGRPSTVPNAEREATAIRSGA
jgi:hypothetical protein